MRRKKKTLKVLPTQNDIQDVERCERPENWLYGTSEERRTHLQKLIQKQETKQKWEN